MIKQFLIILALAVLAVEVVQAGNSVVNAVSKNCLVAIGSKRNYIAQWPLIFDQQGKLYPTLKNEESGEHEIVIKGGEEVTFSCGPNYFKHHTPTEVLKVRCNEVTGNFTANGLEQAANDLTCDLRVIEEILDTVYGCIDSKWTAARFGYVDPTVKQTILLGEACYDMAAGQTRFVHIKLGDQAFSHLEVLPKNYLTKPHHPDGRYKIELFRGLRFDEIYERIRSTIHTRQAPLLKMSHLIEEPLLPNLQFQAIKKLSWNYYVGYDENETLQSLKANIKRLSETSNLDIYAGSHGVKQLFGDKNEHMEIYLHEAPRKRFPMPKLLWFVVKSADKAIAFGVSNDSGNANRLVDDLRTVKPDENICKENDCSKVTWLSADLKHDKHLICCDVNDFRQVIEEVPILGGIKGLLI